MALTKLIADGRSTPPDRGNRREEPFEIEVDAPCREQAAYDAGVPGLHAELIRLLGRLKYRTSYGQNVLNHCIETARLAGMLAAELGANVNEAKRPPLHDIGKAVDHEVEGPHAQIGADIAARFGVPPTVCNAIRPSSGGRSGHDRSDRGPDRGRDQRLAPRAWGEAWMATSSASTTSSRSPSASPVSSAATPSVQGARSGSSSIPRRSTTPASSRLARDVVRKIEEQLQSAVQIKVTVIRETRAVDYAR